MEYFLLTTWFTVLNPAGIVFFLLLKKSRFGQPYKIVFALFTAGFLAIVLFIITLAIFANFFLLPTSHIKI